MGTFLQDLRYAFRVLARNPGFAVMAALSLALGIGASTAIFSVINASSFSPLPVKNPGQLLLVTKAWKKFPDGVTQSGYGNGISYPVFADFQKQTDLFASVFGYASLGFGKKQISVKLDGQSSFAEGDIVTGSYFPGLDVSPLIGRWLVPNDEADSAEHVVVISYDYWSRQFARSPVALGKSISLNGDSFAIVGVMPRGFFGIEPGRSPDFWIPIVESPGISPWTSGSLRPFSIRRAGWFWMETVVRLNPGVSEEQARVRLENVAKQSMTANVVPSPGPDEFPTIGLQSIRNGIDRVQKRFASPLHILTAIVGMLLLIACANVATLLLARASARQKEIGVRISVGASRSRLLRQLLTESVLLAAIGGMGGLILAHWGTRALMLVLSQGRRRIAMDIQVDWTILLFAMGLSLLTGILFGLAPAFRAMKVDILSTLKGSVGATVRGRGWRRLDAGKSMVVIQVAASLALLISTGLLVRTVQNLSNRDVGFNQRNLILFGIEPRRYGIKGSNLVSFYDQLSETLQQVPEVTSVSLSTQSLISGSVNNGRVTMLTDSKHPDLHEAPAQWNGVGAQFFETLGMQVVAGRGIGARDMALTPRVAVVNEAWVRQVSSGENPIGRRFHLGSRANTNAPYEIVGVVRDAPFASMREAPTPTAYLPYVQWTAELSASRDSWAANPGAMNFEVRTSVDARTILPVVSRAVAKLLPDAPLMNLTTQQDQIAESMASERTFAQLTTAFSVMALLLACIGLHGTLAYAVTRRTREFGIRMALGAQRLQVIWMILRDSLIIIAVGTALGLPLAAAGSKLLESTLYGLTSTDPLTIGLAIVALAVAGTAAGLTSARRAATVDPMVALRYE
jgi:predicted permease